MLPIKCLFWQSMNVGSLVSPVMHQAVGDSDKSCDFLHITLVNKSTDIPGLYVASVMRVGRPRPTKPFHTGLLFCFG